MARKPKEKTAAGIPVAAYHADQVAEPKTTPGAHALKTFAELVAAVEKVVDYHARRSSLRDPLKRARRALARIGVGQ